MNEKLIVSVSFDETNGNYKVQAGEGSSVPEVAFAISIIMKCFLKEKLIDNIDDFTNLVKKYLTDPQYEELKNE